MPHAPLDGFVGWPKEFADRYRERGYWRGRTLGALLRERAAATPDAVAVVDGARRWTYRELDERADRLASGLCELGLAPGDRVLVQLPNCAEFLQLAFALFRIGAVPVMTLPAHREAEIAHLAGLSEAVAYVVADTHLGFDHRPLARSVRDRVPGLRHVLVAGDAQEFTDLAELEREPQPLPEPDPSGVALLLLSGGTTGAPKLIPRTHDDYLYNATASAAMAGLDAATRYLVALPVAHNFPLACPGVLGTLHAGGTVVMCPTPSPDVAFPLIARERITVTALVPSLALLWLEAKDWSDDDLGSLQLLQVGGSRLQPETARRITPELGCRLQQVFGMAEGLLNYTRLDDPQELILHTQGRPLAEDDDLRIVDAQDRDVPEGDPGELLVRGPYTLRGYYRAAEHNARAFTEDGYYRSGDLVRRLPSGHLVVAGRIKDVINRAGEKIPVEEVENHLLGHPAIHDVAVIGLPDAELGERTCACVIARGTPPQRADLTAHLTERGLAAYKLPDEVRVLTSFPRTALGKVDKGALIREVTG
ncbi:2,3-dihydroxybenzoate-AMP ligase [Streptomyces sp. 2333.5]|uniref:(2,3-dihydroxybenzoyl)adenylate synthase n=1 Tax=unclassified Streptomyces TaxID=2593676 RepID=UPI00089C3833|nr:MULTISPECIES: AMP-binding protein [unclassified Streptomyces]PJJ05990.1 2,3-dihydroxybenzoate-AMP ligase [Streptomyces sp. 2333.5]SEE88215.1 2,3-dihydroxybenzoate-AMP ligase [Streptomyces sp. 2314.4]SEF05790.1 2,3-dihydroxybenzoate-AMP ligase [Streptomyces sp. 2112.2]